MKIMNITRFLGFNSVIKELLPYLHTICGYYDSRNFCLYIICFLLFIRLAQMYPFNENIFESLFPENSIRLQNTLTLIENTSFTNFYKIARNRTAQEKMLLSYDKLDYQKMLYFVY